MSETSTIIQSLVPGSRWKRVRKGRESISTVLAVSNLNVAAATLDKFPQQVVFLSEKLSILTQDVDTFIETREVDSIDTGVANIMDALVTPPVEDEEALSEGDNLVDLASIELPTEEGESTETAESSDDTDYEEDETPIFTPAVWDGVQLNHAFLSYNETPHHTGDTVHQLRFLLSDDLTLDHLRDIFDSVGGLPESLSSFQIASQYETTQVEPTGFIQVFLEVLSSGDAVGVVYVVTDGDARARTANEVTQEAVDVQATPVTTTEPKTSEVSEAQSGEGLRLIPQIPVQEVSFVSN